MFRKLVRWANWIMITLIVAGVTIAIMFPDPAATKQRAEDAAKRAAADAAETARLALPENRAKISCKYMAPKVMNDPGSTEIDDTDTFIVKKTVNETYDVTMGLRAKNRFNALVYDIYICTVQLTPDGGSKLIDFKLKG